MCTATIKKKYIKFLLFILFIIYIIIFNAYLIQQLLGNSGLWGITSPSIVYMGSWILGTVPIAKLAISSTCSVCSCDPDLGFNRIFLNYLNAIKYIT